MPLILNDIASRALQIHGSLGISHDMPFAEWIINSFRVGLADGEACAMTDNAWICREIHGRTRKEKI